MVLDLLNFARVKNIEISWKIWKPWVLDLLNNGKEEQGYDIGKIGQRGQREKRGTRDTIGQILKRKG